MQELSKRIASLPSEKRRLLEQLLRKEGVTEARLRRTLEGAMSESESLTQGLAALALPEAEAGTKDQLAVPEGPLSAADKKARNREFYDSVSKQLNSTMAGDYSFFLSFGYVADSSPQFSSVLLPAYYLNRNSVKLVLELLGDCAVSGLRVLDVGCGRGGTVQVLSKFFNPEMIVGLELSSSAVAFCRRVHAYPHAFFLEGDAESLPFPNESFDVITNVESSHSYPEIFAFYAEVHRTLRKGGYFLYTDLFVTALLRGYIRRLQDLGFVVESERDITHNVLLSCDESANVHRKTFHATNDPELIGNFLGLPGSQVYKGMNVGQSTYRIFKLAKTD